MPPAATAGGSWGSSELQQVPPSSGASQCYGPESHPIVSGARKRQSLVASGHTPRSQPSATGSREAMVSVPCPYRSLSKTVAVHPRPGDEGAQPHCAAAHRAHSWLCPPAPRVALAPPFHPDHFFVAAPTQTDAAGVFSWVGVRTAGQLPVPCELFRLWLHRGTDQCARMHHVRRHCCATDSRRRLGHYSDWELRLAQCIARQQG
jgi:hypothetical protein